MLDGSKSIFKNIRRKVHCFECGEKIKMNTTKYIIERRRACAGSALTNDTQRKDWADESEDARMECI